MLRECLEGKRDMASVFSALEASGLRGLGGAGFPAGRKWRIVRDEPAPRLLAVNIDEGEPDSKDRVYLESDPHRSLEGMLIAAWAVGIDAGCYIYLRDEYHGCRTILQRELAALRSSPSLRTPAEDSGAPWVLPHIELRRGAGAYICGEESAMIESIEGKRGEPRLRPPFIAQVGTLQQASARAQLRDAALDSRDSGARQRVVRFAGPQWPQGSSLVSVSGRVKQPGMHLAPAGITLRELINQYCGGMSEGHELYAYLQGGASAASCRRAGRRAARLRYVAAVRLVYRIGRDHRAVAAG